MHPGDLPRFTQDELNFKSFQIGKDEIAYTYTWLGITAGDIYIL